MFTVNIYFKQIYISNSSNQSIFCDYTFICERKLSWPPPSCVADGLLTYDPPPPDTHRACKEASNRWTIDPKPGVWWGRVWVSSLTPALRWNRPTELTLNWEQTRSRRQIIRSVLCWSVRTLLNQSLGVWSLVNWQWQLQWLQSQSPAGMKHDAAHKTGGCGGCQYANHPLVSMDVSVLFLVFLSLI